MPDGFQRCLAYRLLIVAHRKHPPRCRRSSQAPGGTPRSRTSGTFQWRGRSARARTDPQSSPRACSAAAVQRATIIGGQAAPRQPPATGARQRFQPTVGTTHSSVVSSSDVIRSRAMPKRRNSGATVTAVTWPCQSFPFPSTFPKTATARRIQPERPCVLWDQAQGQPRTPFSSSLALGPHCTRSLRRTWSRKHCNTPATLRCTRSRSPGGTAHANHGAYGLGQGRVGCSKGSGRGARQRTSATPRACRLTVSVSGLMLVRPICSRSEQRNGRKEAMPPGACAARVRFESGGSDSSAVALCEFCDGRLPPRKKHFDELGRAAVRLSAVPGQAWPPRCDARRPCGHVPLFVPNWSDDGPCCRPLGARARAQSFRGYFWRG